MRDVSASRSPRPRTVRTQDHPTAALGLVLSRRGGVAVRDQIVTQLELRILDGTLSPGQRLPSIRALARRLKVHANTVSAAYQQLEASGHVDPRPGSGVFVRRQGPLGLADARGLDEMIRLALDVAHRKGYTGPQIRAAVKRWLAGAPPERVVVVDPSRETAELLVHELARHLGIPAEACTPAQLARAPHRLADALGLVLAYHLDTIRRIAPQSTLETLRLEFSPRERQALQALPGGSIVLVVSHAPALLPFASVLLHSLRGDDILVETALHRDRARWRRWLPAADLVFADALSIDAVRRAHPKRLLEFHLLRASDRARLQALLTAVVPRAAP